MKEDLIKRDVFSAIADPTRRELLKLLSGEELAIMTLCEQFSITRTAVSKHLHVLEEAGLVFERKVGRETRYRLNPEPLKDVKDWLKFYEQFWDNKLSLLKAYVEGESFE